MKTEKKFDAVRNMREIRDAISREIQGMSFEEQEEYMKKQLRPRREGDQEGRNRRQPN